MPSPENSTTNTSSGTNEHIYGGRLNKKRYRRRRGPPPCTKTMWWRFVEDNRIECEGTRPVPRFCHTMCSTQLESSSSSSFPSSVSTNTNNTQNDGLIFVIGGYDVDSRFNDVWAFNPHLLQWIQKPIMGVPPSPRHNHACAVISVNPIPPQTSNPNLNVLPVQFRGLPETRHMVGPQDSPILHALVPREPYILLFGGASKGGTALEDTSILHVSADCWTWHKLPNRFAADLPKGRYGHSMNYCPGIKSVVLFGGYDSQQYFSDLWIFHVESLTWEKKLATGDRPSPRWCHSSILIGPKLFVFGGRGPNKRLYNDIYVLDTERFDWSLINSCGQIPPPMYGHTAVYYRHRMFLVHGGWDEKSMTNDTFLFDTDSIEWFKLIINDPPLGRTCHTSVYFEFPVSNQPQGNEPKRSSPPGENAGSSSSEDQRRSCAIVFGGYSNGNCSNELLMLEYTDLDHKQLEEHKPQQENKKPKKFTIFRGLFERTSKVKAVEKQSNMVVATEINPETQQLQNGLAGPSMYGAIDSDFVTAPELRFDQPIVIDNHVGGYDSDDDYVNSTTPLRRNPTGPNQAPGQQLLRRNTVGCPPQAPNYESLPHTYYQNNAFAVESLNGDPSNKILNQRMYPHS